MNLKVILTALAVLVPSVALACAPAPSCWFKYSPKHLRAICRGYATNGKTLKELASLLDEPDKIAEFGEACRKLHVHLRPE